MYKMCNYRYRHSYSKMAYNPAYNLESAEFLGRGSFGKVYGIDEHTAIKKVDIANDERTREATLAEIRLMLDFKL